MGWDEIFEVWDWTGFLKCGMGWDEIFNVWDVILLCGEVPQLLKKKWKHAGK